MTKGFKKGGLAVTIFMGLLVSRPCSAIYELGANFSYSKKVYGNSRQNSLVSRGHGGSLTIYFLTYTGLELNYNQTEDINTQNDRINLGAGLSITSTQNKVETKIYGLGIRQALAPSRFFVIPVLSLGYAKQVREGGTTYTLDNNGEKLVFEGEKERLSSDSMFGSFLLKFKFTQLLSLNASVRSVFEPVKFDQIKDYLRYEIGLSWIF